MLAGSALAVRTGMAAAACWLSISTASAFAPRQGGAASAAVLAAAAASTQLVANAVPEELPCKGGRNACGADVLLQSLLHVSESRAPRRPVSLQQLLAMQDPEVQWIDLRAKEMQELPWEEHSASEPIVSCKHELAAEEDGAEGNLARAVRRFCDAGLPLMVDFHVDKKFEGNREKLVDTLGWFPEAFVTYVALHSEDDKIAKETDLLLQSVHHFSTRPIVVANFGTRVPEEWTAERFPRMVLVHARSVPAGVPFDMNKLRAMMFTKVRVGIVVDADQWINEGMDRMFQRASEEGSGYAFPIMPVHWMSRDPAGGDYDSYTFVFQSPEAPKRTMRWGHAHPTWTHESLDFLAKWTSRVLAPDATHSPEWLKAEGTITDEPTLNIGLWAEGATKQWCKFDIGDPSEFAMFTKQKAPKLIHEDKRWFPRGIPMVFYSAHNAKKPSVSLAWLQKLWEDDLAPKKHKKLILYDGHWFDDGAQLQQYDPELRCII